MNTKSSQEHYGLDVPDEDRYTLGRNYVASARLAMLHLLIHAQFRYLIHPAIAMREDSHDLSIADVGTGTGIWLGEVAKSLPSSAKLYGFDISDEQYPPAAWYGDNVELSKLDIFKPVPATLRGKFDVVHLRFFMTIAKDDTIQTCLRNLAAMLKPGGYLQWVERDWLSKFPDEHGPRESANAALSVFLKKYWNDITWINNLPLHFERAGLDVVASEAQSPLPVYRKPWNEDNLIGIGAFGEKLKDEEEKKWFFEQHARAAAEAATGWYVDWELVMCVGQKPKS